LGFRQDDSVLAARWTAAPCVSHGKSAPSVRTSKIRSAVPAAIEDEEVGRPGSPADNIQRTGS